MKREFTEQPTAGTPSHGGRARPLERLSFMNGWQAAPHCWRHHLVAPPKFTFTPACNSFSWLGFVIHWW